MMSKEEFINIYFTGSDIHVKEAIEEMNKKHNLNELSIILGITANQFRYCVTKLGIKANKKVFKKSLNKKWN